MGRGTHRGFITHEELSKSLGKRNLSDENLSQAFIHILDDPKQEGSIIDATISDASNSQLIVY